MKKIQGKWLETAHGTIIWEVYPSCGCRHVVLDAEIILDDNGKATNLSGGNLHGSDHNCGDYPDPWETINLDEYIFIHPSISHAQAYAKYQDECLKFDMSVIEEEGTKLAW